ncbi:hypothetical protein JQ595_27050 [Bradyrhizobium japonicum]|uniref:hypothetical protein n=1 Tax=Bradyrhizobium japonicum TaxID=375 RepID=UPI001BACF043|nr:hypothetical protein [Bradyrhizobium japonicum]MBR0732414.1 hypothetical protein [Bradyrhizobium japonicum]
MVRLTPTDDEALTDLDRDALERCIPIARRLAPIISRAIDSTLARDGWEEAARYACFHCQVASLGVPPWQPVPCQIGPHNMAWALSVLDEQRGYRAAALLRQRMDRCGVSCFEPDPVRACDFVEAERATK